MNGRLIINVDDFGLSESINQSIEVLAELGTISATNIMPNMPFAQHVKELSEKFPNLSYGVHINLTQGKPIMPTKQIPSLIAPDGNFYPLNTLIKRALLGKIDKNDCEQEIYAQVNLMKKLLGEKLDHWNSHQGIHRVEPFFSVANKICQKFSIPSMRSISHGFFVDNNQIINSHLGDITQFNINRIVKETYYRFLTNRSNKRFNIPDGTLAKQGLNTIELLAYVINHNLPPGFWEIACHTAISTEGLWGTSLLQQRVEEFNILRSEPCLNAVENGLFKLVGYKGPDIENSKINNLSY